MVDISGNLILVEIGRILRLVDLSRFSRFQFRVRVVGYKALLLITGGGK